MGLKILSWKIRASRRISGKYDTSKVSKTMQLNYSRDFEEGVPTLFLNILPSITARKAYNARKVLTSAFHEYYDKGLDRNANSFVKGRARAARVENFTNRDLAGFEITICFASLTNTVPTAFSMLCYVLSDPVLTAEICEEVSSITIRTMVNGIVRVSLDITSFNTKCPLLVSAFQETIRMCVHATPIRVVTEDMLLKESYVLKKGGIVLVAGGAIQESRKVWGEDAETFNGRRFMNKKALNREQKKAQAQGLLPFGGGKHLCPGRHLAFTEVVSFVAIMVYGFEVRMKDGSGLVKPPPFKTQQLGEISKKPAHDIEVLIRRKKEFKDVMWSFDVDPSANIEKVSAV
jgi:cytochrome P450